MELSDEEINQAIHERVMGAKWYKVNPDHPKAYPEIVGKRWLYDAETGDPIVRSGWWVEADGTEPVDAHECQAISYAASISDAFKVVEKMEADGWVWTFSKNTNDVAASYDVRFFLMDRAKCCPEKRSIAIENSLPRAICLAALKCLEGRPLPAAYRGGE